MMNIKFDNQYYTIYKRHKTNRDWELFMDFGTIIAFCFGGSLVALFELIHYFFVSRFRYVPSNKQMR